MALAVYVAGIVNGVACSVSHRGTGERPGLNLLQCLVELRRVVGAKRDVEGVGHIRVVVRRPVEGWLAESEMKSDQAPSAGPVPSCGFVPHRAREVLLTGELHELGEVHGGDDRFHGVDLNAARQPHCRGRPISDDDPLHRITGHDHSAGLPDHGGESIRQRLGGTLGQTGAGEVHEQPRQHGSEARRVRRLDHVDELLEQDPHVLVLEVLIDRLVRSQLAEGDQLVGEGV